ncbi:MAG: M28 family peptidase [Bacteroidales bacterium]|nr:M28 family peptidase [Bacteroidales bacterium]
MKKTGLYLIIASLAAMSIAVSLGLFSMPPERPETEDSFSVERVQKDIKFISSDHHSIIHPEQRNEVRDYLISRLRELGTEPALYSYPDSEGKGYKFDAVNIVGDWAPADIANAGNARLLIVAHYDSRYPWAPVRDTVCSYGAADDGYGVGSALETVTILLRNRESWSQGVRLLLTDAEEVGMVGMKKAYELNPELFEDVGLVINIEARGTYGPVLLFETSPGNDRIMELYEGFSRYPHTYSLTNVVYRMMPNFTDFTIVKDELPGVNFSTISDVNHYHTDKDCFANISASSIRHYGAQIVPLAEEFVRNPEYADRDSLRGSEDRVFFTVPLLGLFNFSKKGYLVVNIVVLLLMAGMLLMERKKMLSALSWAGLWLLFAVVALIVGEVAARIGCQVSGAKFALFGTVSGMQFDNALMLGLAVALALVIANMYRRGKVQEKLKGCLILLAVLDIILLAVLGENLFVLIPLAVSSLVILLWKISGWKLFLPVGMALILLHACSFLYDLSMALTVGAVGAVLLIATFEFAAAIGLAALFCSEER